MNPADRRFAAGRRAHAARCEALAERAAAAAVRIRPLGLAEDAPHAARMALARAGDALREAAEDFRHEARGARLLAFDAEREAAIRLAVDGGEPVTLAAFLEANRGALPLSWALALRRLAVGEVVTVGGGAGADFEIRRVE